MPAPHAGAATAAIEITGLSHRYGAETVLALDRWRVARGARCLVLGPSGSGKTTLLNILAGLATPSAGQVRVDGVELGGLGPAERDRFRARHLGLVPQRLHLIAAITVADNLRLARRLAGLPDDEARIRALLEQLGLAALAGRRPDALSQGQAQRAAVARALVNQPVLLLADEPTAALDEANAEAAIGLIEAAAKAGSATLVVASHDRRIAKRFPEQLSLPSTPGGQP